MSSPTLTKNKDTKDAKKEVKAPSTRAKTPTLSGFDLLGGSYQRVQSARLAAMGTLGVLVIAFAGVASWGLLSMTSTSSAQGELANARASQNVAQQEYNDRTQVGSVTSTQIQADLEARGPAAKTAAQSEVDLSKLLNDFSTVSPAGVSVTGLSLVSAAAAEGAAAPVAPVEGAAPVAAAASTFEISVTASASSYQQVAEWENALKNIPYLVTVGAPAFSGSESGGESGGITITTTGSISTDQLATARLTEINQLTAGGVQ